MNKAPSPSPPSSTPPSSDHHPPLTLLPPRASRLAPSQRLLAPTNTSSRVSGKHPYFLTNSIHQ